jgi:hypothetical protein
MAAVAAVASCGACTAVIAVRGRKSPCVEVQTDAGAR